MLSMPPAIFSLQLKTKHKTTKPLTGLLYFNALLNLRSHQLQLFFHNKSINQFFHYGFIIIAKLFNSFELL